MVVVNPYLNEPVTIVVEVMNGDGVLATAPYFSRNFDLFDGYSGKSYPYLFHYLCVLDLDGPVGCLG